MSGRTPEELVRLLQDSLERAGREGEPPTYEQLEAYVDGALDPVDREIVESWLADDADLRADVDAMRQLQAELVAPPEGARIVPFAEPPPREVVNERPRTALWWQIAAAVAVAAAVVIAAGIVRRVAPPAPSVAGPDFPPPPVPASERPPTLTGLAVRDRGAVIGLASDGSLAGLDRAEASVRDAVARALRAGRLPEAPSVAALAGRTGVLMAGGRSRSSFAVIGPRATAVATARPTFRWRALPGATAYRVRVVDESLAVVAESAPAPGTTWQPPTALPRGRVLSWQVEADTPDGSRSTPAPPQPEARIVVLPAEEAERVAAALAATPSDLAGAVIAAEAGLYDEAEAALARLATANPSSGTIDALRRDLAARRSAR